MALSGHIIKNVGDWWRLRLEWAATQNVTANTSTVTCRLYWQSLHSTAAVYSSSPKATVINVNGTKKESTATVGINGNASKLLQTSSFTVSHNTDGTGSFTVDAACTLNLTLDGVWVGYTSVGSHTFTLNTIPRASYMSSTANMKAGEYKPFSLSVASSSFTHTVNMYVNDTWIKRVEGIQTSGQFTFSLTELGNIYTAMSQKSTGTVKFTVTTYNSGSTIGTTEKSGTITAPGHSTWTLKPFYNIGDTIGSTLTRQNEYVDCDIGIYTTDGNTKLASIADNTKASTVTFDTSTIASTIYAKIPNAIYYDAVIKVWTNCNDVQLNTGPMAYTIRLYVANSEPTFTDTSCIYYWDSNSTISGKTGNNLYIVQNKSNLNVGVNVSGKATAKNSATMSHYLIECAGKTAKVAYSASDNVSVSLGTIDAKTNQSIKVSAVDSRGLKTTLSKEALIIPYSAPQVTLTAKRTNNFEAETTVTAKIACSSVTVADTEKNSLTSFKYQTRESGGTYGSLTSDTTSGFPNITKSLTLTFDNTKAYDIQVQVVDNFGSSVTKSVSIETGKPILYINAETNTVGVNKQTTGSNGFEVDGSINATGNEYCGGYIQAGTYLQCGSSRTYTTTTSTYGLDMKNSDIIGANGIYFNDTSASGTMEGLNFPKSTLTSSNKTSADQYNTFWGLDGNLYLDGEIVFSSNKANNLLFNINGLYMNESHQGKKPSKSLSECQNGWLLIWSGFDYTTSTVQNAQWNYQLIPKCTAPFDTDSTILVCAHMIWYATPVRKFLYTNGIVLTGHESNDSYANPGDQYGFYDNRRLVLRWVYEY